MKQLSHKQSFAGGLLALILATSCCWLPFLAVALGGVSGLLGTVETLEKYSGLFMLLSLLFIAFGFYQYKNKSTMQLEIKLNSTITCPECGFQKTEEMPTNACQFFYDCDHCKAVLKPKEGDCCVYCSYGTVPCPPMQSGADCCSSDKKT